MKFFTEKVFFLFLDFRSKVMQMLMLAMPGFHKKLMVIVRSFHIHQWPTIEKRYISSSFVKAVNRSFKIYLLFSCEFVNRSETIELVTRKNVLAKYTFFIPTLHWTMVCVLDWMWDYLGYFLTLDVRRFVNKHLSIIFQCTKRVQCAMYTLYYLFVNIKC